MVYGIQPKTAEALAIRRTELERQIRSESRVMNAVPVLADEPWADQWRQFQVAGIVARLAEYRRELQQITAIIGPSGKERSRLLLRTSERYVRQHDEAAMVSLWA